MPNVCVCVCYAIVQKVALTVSITSIRETLQKSSESVTVNNKDVLTRIQFNLENNLILSKSKKVASMINSCCTLGESVQQCFTKYY